MEEPLETEERSDASLKRLRRRAMNISTYRIERQRRTTQQMRDILVKKEIPEDIITETIQKLIEMELLNDEAYIRDYTLDAITFQQLGKQAVAMKLRMKGLKRDDFKEQLDALFEETDERENALDLAMRRARTYRNIPDDKKFNRLFGYLCRKGYSSSVAFSVAKEALAVEVDTEDF